MTQSSQLGYLTATGVSYRGTLPKISKSSEKFQPLFEAFTNAFEAIKLADLGRLGTIEIIFNLQRKMFASEIAEMEFLGVNNR